MRLLKNEEHALTDDGRLFKVINRAVSDHQMEPVVIEVLQVFSAPITHMKIYFVPENSVVSRPIPGATQRDKALLVASWNAIVSLPLHRCNSKKTCR